MKTLGGTVCIRNGDVLDYPWRECVQSLLPVCDEVVICVGSGGEDKTEASARQWAEQDSKVKVCIYEWPNPKGDNDFWVNWLNYAREHLRTDYHFQLDADEVLHEKCHASVRSFMEQSWGRSARVTRHNFWRDHQHTIPEGHCLGKRVIRIAPSKLWMPSDGVHHKGSEVVSRATLTDIEIFHYGFIRKPEAFFKKERLLQNYFFNYYDPRLEAAEKSKGNWMESPSMPEWCSHLDEFTGTHPAIMKHWLKYRGYK
jgi:glycosyltransferase involved in cell wall biosynthesis